MNQDLIRQRIQGRLDALNFSANFVSERAGLDRSALGRFLNGKVQDMRESNLRAIAEALRCDVAYLKGETDRVPREPDLNYVGLRQPAADVPIVGIVEAGAFRPGGFYSGVDLGVISGGFCPEFTNARQFGLAVRGDSMDLAGILDGDKLVCVDPNLAGVDITDGDLVIVENALDSGQTVELTVKQIKIYPDRFELVPCSSNPKHQPIVIATNADAGGSPSVRVVGVVVTMIRNFRVRRSARDVMSRLTGSGGRAADQMSRAALVG